MSETPAAAILAAFAKAKAEGRPAFIPYVTAGYPRRDATVPVMLAMERAGADVIELGVPFSDPIADGPTIQYSNTIALGLGVSFTDCLGFVREARSRGLRAPVVLMGYVNPLLSYGEERAVADAAEAGVNAFIVVDLPREENPGFHAACRRHGVSVVPLVAPTSLDKRIAELTGTADSFVYCVSVTGVTGQRSSVAADLPTFLGRIRAVTKQPLAVGFGISTHEHYKTVGAVADAVVIGSAVIKAIRDSDEGDEAEAVFRYIRGVTGRTD